jgi:hypothetical protein
MTNLVVYCVVNFYFVLLAMTNVLRKPKILAPIVALFELILWMYRRGDFAVAPIHPQNSECGKREIASEKIINDELLMMNCK